MAPNETYEGHKDAKSLRKNLLKGSHKGAKTPVLRGLRFRFSRDKL